MQAAQIYFLYIYIDICITYVCKIKLGVCQPASHVYRQLFILAEQQHC